MGEGREMAGILAALHWGVGVDGRDVEFVLGGERVNGEDQGLGRER